MVSQTVQYALRAMAYLAAGDGTPVTSDRIAAATGIPGGYLSKIMRVLVVRRLVLSSRGRRGGFTLARPARDIPLAEVVDAVEPARQQRRPGAECDTPRTDGELVERRIEQMFEALERAFVRTTLAELASGRAEQHAPGNAA